MHPTLSSVDPTEVTKKVIMGVCDGVTTSHLDKLAAETAAAMGTVHPEYSELAARIAISDLQKNTSDDFMEVFRKELLYVHPETGKPSPLISQEVFDIIDECQDLITEVIDYTRDFNYDYFGFKTLERSYLARMNGRIIERPAHMLIRVSFGVHKRDIYAALQSYDWMSMLMFTFATPTLFNAGTTRPQMSSCFLLTMTDDSIEGIYDTLKRCALISKSAGGIGLSIHKIRSSGTYIRGANGGISNGLVPMLKVYNDTARYVDQGGGRRPGAFAIYLEPWHFDIFDFLNLKKNTGKEEDRARDLFYGLWIPDLFMRRTEANEDWSLFSPDECPGLADVWGKDFEKLYTQYEKMGKAKKTIKAQSLWFAIVESQIETGTPYVMFKDAANAKSNQRNLGTIRSSNLCVSGDTLLLTDKGQIPIRELSGQTTTVWNGEEWSEDVEVFQTGENKDLLHIEFSNGSHLDCTPEHTFYLQRAYHSKTPLKMEAQDLPKGAKLIKWELPSIIEFEYPDKFKYAYTHGFFCGDGTCYKSYDKTELYPRVTLYGEKIDLLEYLDYTSFSDSNKSGVRNVTLPKDMARKFVVPMESSVEDRLRWLEGYCDAVGTITRNGTNESIQIGSIEKEFLKQIRLMLQTLGVESKVTQSQGKRKTLLPDGRGGQKEYDCKPLWRLLINSNDLFHLSQLGFSPNRLKFKPRFPQRKAAQYVKVTSISDGPRGVDTFCFTEPKRHMGIFNGIQTGQCSEIIQYSSKEEVAVCNLASLALPRFAVEVEHVIKFDFRMFMYVTRHVMRGMNCVIDGNYYPIPETKLSNMRHRPVGLGVQGLADLFQQMRLPWETKEAEELNAQIFACMYYAALDESCKIAKESGHYHSFHDSPASLGYLQFDLWDVKPITDISGGGFATSTINPIVLDWVRLKRRIMKHGLKNSLVLALMPTASTSQILGNNECMEPYTSNIYTRRTNAGDYIVVNKQLVRDLMKEGIWSPAMKELLIAHKGSVQNIEIVPDHLKPLYKTAWEIKQKCLIDHAAGRGVYIDQSQSLNLFMEEPTYAKVTSAHFYVWKKGLKGTYYLRSKPAADPIAFTVDPSLLVKTLKKSVNGTSDVSTSDDTKDPPTDYSGEIPRCGLTVDGCLACSS